VSAGLAPLALGSQTIGSIIRPAAYCGTIGYKPTMRRIATEGVVPLSPALDTVGFFTQDLDGLELAASVLCKDWVDISTGDEKPTLGIPAGPYLEKATAEGREHFFKTAERLREAGFTVKTIEAMPDFDEIVVWHNDMVAGEIAHAHQEWFEEYRELYHPKTAALIERGRQVALESIKVYQAEREWLRSELRELMLKNEVSVWISPPAPGTAPKGINFTGDPIMNLPWTYAGVPVITVPAGVGANGLPLGLQLAADCNRDEQLVRWTKQIAQALAN
jgi:Asp-tRNA(Asn)/Glu-tRNA(Gln) amidotransferase A subunit family amidase